MRGDLRVLSGDSPTNQPPELAARVNHPTLSFTSTLSVHEVNPLQTKDSKDSRGPMSTLNLLWLLAPVVVFKGFQAVNTCLHSIPHSKAAMRP
jgi:hypothetical protein